MPELGRHSLKAALDAATEALASANRAKEHLENARTSGEYITVADVPAAWKTARYNLGRIVKYMEREQARLARLLGGRA